MFHKKCMKKLTCLVHPDMFLETDCHVVFDLQRKPVYKIYTCFMMGCRFKIVHVCDEQVDNCAGCEVEQVENCTGCKVEQVDNCTGWQSCRLLLVENYAGSRLKNRTYFLSNQAFEPGNLSLSRLSYSCGLSVWPYSHYYNQCGCDHNPLWVNFCSV